MYKKITPLLRRYKILVENFISLLSLQGLNYILPLVTVPYLIRVLGIEGFGVVVLIQAVIGYCKIIINYGFRLTGVRDISSNVKNGESLSKIFSDIIYTKLCLLLLSVVICYAAIFFLDAYKEVDNLIIYAILELLGTVLFLDWFFQGVQKMKFVTLINVISKVTFTILIFLLVKSPDHIYIVILCSGFGTLIGGGISFYIAWRDYELRLTEFNGLEIIQTLRNGWYVFLSMALVFFYTSINILILGMLTNPILVGYYAVADKIFSAIRSLAGPFNTTIFPHLSALYNESKSDYNRFIKKSFLSIVGVFATIACVSFFIHPFAFKLLAGQEYNIMISDIFIILIPAIIFIPLGPFFTQILVIENKNKGLLKSIIFIVAANLVLVFLLISNYDVIGLAINTLVISILSPMVLLTKTGRNIFTAS